MEVKDDVQYTGNQGNLLSKTGRDKAVVGRFEGEYKHIISLGYFCSTALEIERFGYRDGSYPFDWVLSHDFTKVLELIKTGFADLFDTAFFCQRKAMPSAYENVKYDIVFIHDFLAHKSFDGQIPHVKEKYQRRIERFYKSISEPTIFIRYIRSAEEYSFIWDNYDMILSLLKQFNSSNDILYIANESIRNTRKGEIPQVFFVAEDEHDSVARKFADKIPDLIRVIDKNFYSAEKREQNLSFYRKKHRFDCITKMTKKMKNRITKYFVKPYQHIKQI